MSGPPDPEHPQAMWELPANRGPIPFTQGIRCGGVLHRSALQDILVLDEESCPGNGQVARSPRARPAGNSADSTYGRMGADAAVSVIRTSRNGFERIGR